MGRIFRSHGAELRRWQLEAGQRRCCWTARIQWLLGQRVQRSAHGRHSQSRQVDLISRVEIRLGERRICGYRRSKGVWVQCPVSTSRKGPRRARRIQGEDDRRGMRPGEKRVEAELGDSRTLLPTGKGGAGLSRKRTESRANAREVHLEAEENSGVGAQRIGGGGRERNYKPEGLKGCVYNSAKGTGMAGRLGPRAWGTKGKKRKGIGNKKVDYSKIDRWQMGTKLAIIYSNSGNSKIRIGTSINDNN